MESSQHANASTGILTYGSPILIIPGVIGNLFCLVVLQQKYYRRTTFGFLLSALALADTGVLLTGLLRLWILQIGNTDVRCLSRIGCKVHVFFTYFFPQLSSWMIVLVTLERTLGLMQRCRRFLTFNVVVLTWMATTLLIVFAAQYPTIVHSLETPHGLGLPDNFTVCIPHQQERLFGDVYSWIDFVFVVFIPFVIIVICNGVIIHNKVKTNKRFSSKIMMLLSMCAVFILTTIPRSVYFLGLPWDGVNTDRKSLFYSSCIIIYNTSNAVNFLLYSVASRKFRTTTRSLFWSNREELQEESVDEDEGQYFVN
ncbi:hypothetical protein CAPTEDRAFT_208609 [Capitella teleta]|uniref:G-protein coupled receptors family 1 profile domain-containing protein n=1 Tax=Capitella teleta TaxID=283909 RepID=R7UIS3_CAPTE|nr:hypothetical protein CAPTEDRAFT_208609 [Capitella teleta]|eukprot:ELU05998.1 hypothetical protein CAPTEDRAFT_208609 [Capitella teleta]